LVLQNKVKTSTWSPANGWLAVLLFLSPVAFNLASKPLSFIATRESAGASVTWPLVAAAMAAVKVS
jgi:hypothetical protein